MSTVQQITTRNALMGTSIAIGLLLDGMEAVVDPSLIANDDQLGEAMASIHAAAGVLADLALKQQRNAGK